MIDEKTLAYREWAAKLLRQDIEAETIRNARRYLALRERFKTEWLCNYLDYGPGKELESSSARLQLDIPSTTSAIGTPPTSPVDAIIIDAAADLLLEGGE